jgi:Carbohydrate-binding module 48 (Isoamylase N-terminal domain)
MMTKTRLTGGSVLVTFELPAAAAAASVSVCGDFNDWSPTSHQLTRTDNGSFQAALELPTGRRWRFRYLLDGQRWENDWAADDYLPNGHGGDDSVVDLTDPSALPLTPVPAADAADRADIADPAAAAGVPAEAGSATSATPRKSVAAEARTGRRAAGGSKAELAAKAQSAESAGKAEKAESAGKAGNAVKAAKAQSAESAGKTEKGAPKGAGRPSTPPKRSAPPVE